MKKFEHYITKKRTKVRGITAIDFDIPAMTVCVLGQDNIIYYNTLPVCYVNSQNAKDYFWGYDINDPKGSLKWNKFRDKLIKAHPDFSRKRDPSFIKAWECYGGVAFFVGDNIKWEWKESTLNSSLKNIQYLLRCIKEDKAPLSIF